MWYKANSIKELDNLTVGTKVKVNGVETTVIYVWDDGNFETNESFDDYYGDNTQYFTVEHDFLEIPLHIWIMVRRKLI